MGKVFFIGLAALVALALTLSCAPYAWAQEAGLLRITAYHDLDGNRSYDLTDAPADNFQILIDPPGSGMGFGVRTDANGYAEFSLDRVGVWNIWSNDCDGYDIDYAGDGAEFVLFMPVNYTECLSLPIILSQE